MGFSYQAGLNTALSVSLIACIACGVGWARRRQPPLLFAVAVPLATFAAAFALANLLWQLDRIDQALIEQEIRNGRLALRFASLLIGGQAVVGAYRLLRRGPDPYPLSAFEAYTRWHEMEARRSQTAYVHQACLYSSVLSVLWMMVVTGRSSIVAVALNWLITFVADDWSILSYFRRRFYIRPPLRYQLQVKAADLVIAALLIVLLGQQAPPWLALAGTVLIVLLFVLAPLSRGLASVYQLLRHGAAGAQPPAPLGAEYRELWERSEKLQDALWQLVLRLKERRRSYGAVVRERDDLADALWRCSTNAGRRGDRAAEPDLVGAGPPFSIFDAIRANDTTRVRELLAKDALLWTAWSPTEGYPLGWAARLGHAEIVEILLEFGANAEGDVDDFPAVATHPEVLTMMTYIGVVQAMVGSADPDPDHPLMEGVRARSPGAVRVLLKAGADPNRRWNGRSPLHYAAHKGFAEIADLLLEAGADPRLRDRDGYDAAQTADRAGHHEIAERLRGALQERLQASKG